MVRHSNFARALAMTSTCLVIPVLAVPVLAAPSLGWAASPSGGDAASAADTHQIEEVVVTATRREERLQNVPISVTALTTKKLEQQQVTDVITLSKVVPGMQSKQALSPLEISVAIRGVTELIPSIAADPAIGTYVDGVYNVVNAGSNNAMIDMERVEVLKGPQGTLFGRNTIGGAISITTAKPTPRFGGYAEVDTGNYGAWTGTGVVNVPLLADLLDSRFVFQHTQHGGYGTNLTTGHPTNTQDQDYFRGTVKFTPTNDWSLIASGFYTTSGGYSSGTNLGYIDPTVSLAPGVLPPSNVLIPAASGHPGDMLSNYIRPGGGQDTYSDLDSRYHLKQYGVTAAITGKINDGVSLKSITAFTHTDYLTISDVDATPYAYLDVMSLPIHAEQFSQEFQIYGDALSNRLKWIAGAYFFSEKATQIANVAALEALAPLYGSTGPNVNNKSYSGFAQVIYELAPKLRLTGGVRYVVDDRAATYHDHNEAAGSAPNAFIACTLANDPYGVDPAGCTYASSVSFSYIPWTVGLDYKPSDDTLLYAKLSQGYRSGAYGLQGPAATGVSAATTNATDNAFNIAHGGPVAPEKLLSPEVGVKFDAFDHKLRVNAAAFYSDYDNVQVTVDLVNATGAPLPTLQNSGAEHIWGGELEATALLGKLQLDGSLGYADPEYVKGPSIGQPVVNVSKLNAAITGSYPIETEAGELTLSSTYSYRSREQLYTLAPGQPAAAESSLVQNGFGLLDARVTFKLANAPVLLSLFGQNLTDARYIVAASSYAAPLSFTNNWPGAPRTFGGSIKYSF